VRRDQSDAEKGVGVLLCEAPVGPGKNQAGFFVQGRRPGQRLAGGVSRRNPGRDSPSSAPTGRKKHPLGPSGLNAAGRGVRLDSLPDPPGLETLIRPPLRREATQDQRLDFRCVTLGRSVNLSTLDGRTTTRSGSARPEHHTTRNPLLLLRLSGVFLLRLAARQLDGLLFQPPPRTTRALTALPLPRKNPSAATRGFASPSRRRAYPQHLGSLSSFAMNARFLSL
jgi:hypothetical protein